MMDRFVELGGNFVDTSNAYVEGESESMLGRYLASRPGRGDRMVVSTKFAPNLFPGDPNGGGARRKALRHQIEGSLRRLGVDYTDLYWLHHWDRHTPINETIGALNDLVAAGKILYMGISDTPAWAASRAVTLAQERGWEPRVALQLEYNLLARTVEGELFRLARDQRLGVIPFGPLASGTLRASTTVRYNSPMAQDGDPGCGLPKRAGVPATSRPPIEWPMCGLLPSPRCRWHGFGTKLFGELDPGRGTHVGAVG